MYNIKFAKTLPLDILIEENVLSLYLEMHGIDCSTYKWPTELVFTTRMNKWRLES